MSAAVAKLVVILPKESAGPLNIVADFIAVGFAGFALSAVLKSSLDDGHKVGLASITIIIPLIFVLLCFFGSRLMDAFKKFQ
jgi:hypothetical protein